jgi:hypothetical protein
MDRGISFYHAVIDVVVVEREQIEGRLVYEGRVAGEEHKKHFMRVKEEYLILKESFQQRGKFDEEDWVYYRYRVNDRKSITEKAWRSLLGKPILAVQDDIPEEEREDNRLLLERAERGVHKAEKTLAHAQKKLEKLEKDATENPQNKNIQEKIEEAKAQVTEGESDVAECKQAQEKTTSLLNMEKERQNRVCESKEKPFTRKESILRLIKNGFWVLVDWGTGYGVKPFRIGFLALVVIFIFACIYYGSGAPYPFRTQGVTYSSVKIFVDWVYFSAMVFATSNPEGNIAYNDAIKFFIMTETLLGVFLMALFVGCYTRKIIR